MVTAPTLPFERYLPLEGTLNLRDIGGYPTKHGRRTRWRTLLRSGSLHDLTAAARVALLDMGLRTVIDLRRTAELAASPNPLLGAPGFSYCSAPLLPDLLTDRMESALPELDALYRAIVDERGQVLVHALRALAVPNGLPALVHCVVGKDRTGLVIALVLDLVGVPRETIACDYALSAGYLRDPVFDDTRARALADHYALPTPMGQLISPPEFMLTTLDHLDVRYGGTRAYLCANGMTDGEIDKLVDGLLEPRA